MTIGPVLVTGAAGFAGSHLLDWLLSQGQTIEAWRRPGIGAAVQVQYPAVTWREVELLDAGDVYRETARLRPTHVYHLAGAPHVGNSWHAVSDTLAINVMATHHLLEGLRRAGGGSRLVVPSTAYVYKATDRPLRETDTLQSSNPYALSKIATELLAERLRPEDGVAVIVSRSFNHIGPRQDPAFFASAMARQIAQIEAGILPPVIKAGNLEAWRDFTDVRDTVRAYQLLVERGRPGAVYNVCSGRPLRTRDLLDGLVRLARVPVTVEIDPARFRPNDTPYLVGDPGTITNELGWVADTPIERTLQDLLDYWRIAERQD